MTMNEIAAQIHFTSTKKGFEAPNKENINQKLLLAVSEICEAQEELRDGRELDEIYYNGLDESTNRKPEGFPIEIADAVIRLFHIMAAVGIDIDGVIRLKMEYNATRPEKHGRQF